jgi:hypothetical protein
MGRTCSKLCTSESKRSNQARRLYRANPSALTHKNVDDYAHENYILNRLLELEPENDGEWYFISMTWYSALIRYHVAVKKKQAFTPPN